MRWLIAFTAFFVPFLLILGLGGLTSSQVEIVPSLPKADIDELHDWMGRYQDVLDNYILTSPMPPSQVMPHMALERFDLRGKNRDGTMWYRSAKQLPGFVWGILWRPPGSLRGSTEGDKQPTLLMPLGSHWFYWERRLPETPLKP